MWVGDPLVSGSQPAVAQEVGDPEVAFEHLWQAFDRNYGIFGPKKVDWDALYALYRPRVMAGTTDHELFDIMASLLGHLNDNHVRLRSEDRFFRSGILGQLDMDDFSLDLVREKYLGGDYEQRVGDVFTYGWLTDAIGYFHFRGFREIEASTAAIDEIIAAFANAEAVVVDVRGNGGGNDPVGNLIADRFADRRRLYMVVAELEAARLTDPDAHYLDREEMDLLAERLLAASRLDDAIRMLELNAREFSDAWESRHWYPPPPRSAASTRPTPAR